jgi:hypothetical protein
MLPFILTILGKTQKSKIFFMLLPISIGKNRKYESYVIENTAL